MLRSPPFSTSAIAWTSAGFSRLKSADCGSSFVWTIHFFFSSGEWTNGGICSAERAWAPGTWSPALPAEAATSSPSCCQTQTRIQMSLSPSPTGPIAQTPT